MPAPNTAERIFRAALKLFERGGAEAVTMRRVADAVGITPMAIYRHFPNREALLKRLSDESFRSIADAWQAHATHPDLIERLQALLTPYLDYALTHPHLFDHAFALRRDDARRFPEDFRERQSPTLTVIADAIEEGMRAGVLRKDDPWQVAMTLWAHAHGLVTLYRAGRFNDDEAHFRAFYQASLRRVIDGIRS
ncbi:MAG TPA: TetR/AcrR family transcriptional regulator [Dyella sp.]|nr:TetR/AcrR family transcriptional regulator [Dyella sp.]